MKFKVTNLIIVLISIFTFFIVGCSSTVLDVKNTEPMITKSQNTSKVATDCIIDNIDNKYGKFFPILQEGKEKGSYTIRVRSYDAGNAAIIEIVPSQNGSIITTRISNNFLFKESLKNVFVGGC